MDDTYDNYEYQLAQVRRQQQAQLAAQQEAQEKEKSQGMGWLKFLSVLFVTIVLDLLDFFSVGTIGTIVGFFGNIFILLVAGISQKKSKAKQAQMRKILIMFLGESIPIVNILPLRTIMWVWAFLASHPEWFAKLAKKLGTASKVLSVASKIPTPIAPELAAAAKATGTAAKVADTASQALPQDGSQPSTMQRALAMRAGLRAARVAQPRS